jgi:hypothetical protein
VHPEIRKWKSEKRRTQEEAPPAKDESGAPQEKGKRKKCQGRDKPAGTNPGEKPNAEGAERGAQVQEAHLGMW